MSLSKTKKKCELSSTYTQLKTAVHDETGKDNCFKIQQLQDHMRDTERIMKETERRRVQINFAICFENTGFPNEVVIV